jgi:uncharacterized MAPEG superfamily protein
LIQSARIRARSVASVIFTDGVAAMAREIYWLTLSLGLTLLFWIPYVLNRMVVRGIGGTFANPSRDAAPLAPWAERARSAHANAAENLVVFAPAAIGVHVMNLGDHITTFACALYFFSRLAHFVVYTAGIPVLRTLAFVGGWAGSAILVARLLHLV